MARVTRMRTRVVNLRREACDVRIDRRSVFGNPFRVGPDGSREDVIRKYRQTFGELVRTDPEFKAAVMALRGQVLG